MKKSIISIKTRIGFGLLLALLFVLFSAVLSADAKTTYAVRSSLKNVTKAAQPEGEWIRKKGKWLFRKEDGTILKDKWISWEGKIHYLGKHGIRVKGWVVYRGKRYYITRQKDLLVSTFFSVGKKKYYAGSKGYILRNRWITKGNDKYYVNSAGCCVRGEQYINGKWYYFKKNGKLDPKKKVTAHVDPGKPMLALTFDDGPGPYTETLLDCLHKYNARATFFMVGTSVPSYPGVVKKMVQYRCELGNHSLSHANMASLGAAGVSSQFAACTARIKAACGHAPTVCRLPYGSGHNNGSVLAATGLPSIYWSVDTRDWANTGNPQHTVSVALSEARNGAIILMHDIHRSTVIAAQSIIPALVARGYQLVTVSELARYKGKTNLVAGRTYYNFY